MHYPTPTDAELISTPDELSLPEPVRAVIFDFDGVMTDNGVIVNQDGIEAVRCDRSDGLGVQLMLRAGVPALVVSKEANPVVAARCRKIGIPVQQGVDDKPPVVLAWLASLPQPKGPGAGAAGGVDPAHAVFVGNDVQDVPAFEAVGCGIAVADAHPMCLARATAVLKRRGGYGAVRELCDAVVAQVTRRGEALPAIARL